MTNETVEQKATRTRREQGFEPKIVDLTFYDALGAMFDRMFDRQSREESDKAAA